MNQIKFVDKKAEKIHYEKMVKMVKRIDTINVLFGIKQGESWTENDPARLKTHKKSRKKKNKMKVKSRRANR